MIIPILLILLTGSLYAQTAKVIQLTPEDANEAKLLYKQKAEVEQKIEDLENKIHGFYLIIHSRDISHGQYAVPKPGWGTGTFEYSEDYKFIVPKQNTILNTLSVVSPFGEGNCLQYYPTTNSFTDNLTSR